MKRVAILLAMLFLTGFLRPSSVAAAQEAALRTTTSTDVVIVLDQSNSMHRLQAGVGNDPSDYRLDAAQMLISMLDMEGSRVAFLPFSGEIHTGADSSFVEITDRRKREEKNKAIESMRGPANLKPDTDLGIALTEAVYLLKNRSDTRNIPMIVVLTDGQNSINDTTKKKTVTKWDEKSKSFIENEIKNYSAVDADALMKSAADLAAGFGYPVYTVALYGENTPLQERKVYQDNLQMLSNLTNGRYYMVEASRTSSLPDIFSEMFATQIGSQMTRELEVHRVEGTDTQYRVQLPILNASVKEANIIVPLKSIRQLKGGNQAVSLKKPVDHNSSEYRDVSGGDQDVLKMQSKNFLFYKIIRPQIIGDWLLEFELSKPAVTAPDITFTLVYNYDISLKAFLSDRDTRSGINTANKPIVLNKNQKLRIETFFVNADGNPAGDQFLYHDYGQGWKTIRTMYRLAGPAGSLLEGDMKVIDKRAFGADLDLSKNEDGFNTLRSGSYTLQIFSEGAGIRREMSFGLDVRNRKPETRKEFYVQPFWVDDPEHEETQIIQTTSYKLKEYFFDPDGDKLTAGNPVPKDRKGQEPARVWIDIDADADEALFIETVLDPATGHFKHGVSSYELEITDSEGVSLKVPFEVRVYSKIEEVLKGYECETDISGLTAAGEAEKNSEIVVSMKIKEKDTALYDTTGLLQQFSGVYWIYDKLNTSKPLSMGSYELSDDASRLEAKFISPNKASSLLVRSVYSFGDKEVPVGDPHEFSLTVNNSPPQLVQNALYTLPDVITFGLLPDLLDFLEKPTSDEVLSIDLSKLFEDSDNEKELKTSLEILAREGESSDPGNILSFEKTEASVIHLNPLSAGSVTLLFSATDGDEQRAEARKNISIRYLPEKWFHLGIIALMSLVALVILLLIFRQARKPKFPINGALQVKEGIALFPSLVYELSPSKKPLPLSHVIGMDLAEAYGLDDAALSNIFLYPRHSVRGSIAIHSKKRNPRLKVELDGQILDKKSLIWEPDQELVLSVADDKTHLRIQFITESQDNHDPYESTENGW